MNAQVKANRIGIGPNPRHAPANRSPSGLRPLDYGSIPPWSPSEFRAEFLEYTGKNQNLSEAIQLAASSTVQREDSLSFKWFGAQEILWNQLTDSIINVQELGVYTLPEMEKALKLGSFGLGD